MAPRRRDTRSSDWIDPAWKLLTARAAVAVAVFAWMQWRTLRGIEHRIDAAERPWIAASVDPVQMTFDDQGGGVTFKATLRNGGTIPATDILASSLLLLKSEKQPFKTACRNYGVGGGIGPTLFKDGTFEKTLTAWLPRKDFGDRFPNLLALCVKYRFAASGRRGESGYLFSIVNRNPPAPDVYFVATTNGTLTPPRLTLTPVGSYHD
jgi:hypothetical protein